LDYELEDVYNMDETGLYSRAHPNKILAQGKVKGRKLQKLRVTLALVVDSTEIDNSMESITKGSGFRVWSMLVDEKRSFFVEKAWMDDFAGWLA
jgi:hypothetical protein